MIKTVKVKCAYDGTIRDIKINIPDDKTKCLAFGCNFEGLGSCSDCYKKIEQHFADGNESTIESIISF